MQNVIFIFVAEKLVNTAEQRLENNIAILVEYFERHRLNLMEHKTEFIVFCKNSQNTKPQITSEKSLQMSSSFCKVSWSVGVNAPCWLYSF